jgi:hypothetical protein
MNYWEDGYLLIEQAVPESALRQYMNEQSELYKKITRPDSYLPSRGSFADASIMRIYQHGTKAVHDINPRFMPMLAEARLFSSRISWHRDCNQNDRESGDSYLGMIIAIEDMEMGSGGFHLIPGSHRWDIDESIINQSSLRTKQNECFQYFDSLSIESGAPEFAFEHKRGDILLWHGHTLHRGANPQKDESRRHSMTVHFTVR